VGKGSRNRELRRQEEELREAVGNYDPEQFPQDRLDPDMIVGTLGAPVDGWTPELIYRYEQLLPERLTVNWAIMVDVFRVDQSGNTIRRKVERIDICHSEIHIHRFRRSDDPEDDLGERDVLMSISAGDEHIVSREFEVQLQLLSLEWPRRVERWIDG
jgi:hypothetical protein